MVDNNLYVNFNMMNFTTKKIVVNYCYVIIFGYFALCGRMLGTCFYILVPVAVAACPEPLPDIPVLAVTPPLLLNIS